ncbi:Oidioi.mRNA.OKI2018_I69.YSR.g17109.t1.cds [Oikopleura dioica]|uniref:Oidioi.mRNA.OKI2018_I69.YSR.g17109.t1.cds n=1 Tax=Oikopleura dioica TaxID=34765 RepID=A0ABN7SI76_OIKDI|nr:Oidioi.mRNA.OKI2018_I69.YSR.g17109.t1.cds [Oikopleura dioica]
MHQNHLFELANGLWSNPRELFYNSSEINWQGFLAHFAGTATIYQMCTVTPLNLPLVPNGPVAEPVVPEPYALPQLGDQDMVELVPVNEEHENESVIDFEMQSMNGEQNMGIDGSSGYAGDDDRSMTSIESDRIPMFDGEDDGSEISEEGLSDDDVNLDDLVNRDNNVAFEAPPRGLQELWEEDADFYRGESSLATMDSDPDQQRLQQIRDRSVSENLKHGINVFGTKQVFEVYINRFTSPVVI